MWPFSARFGKGILSKTWSKKKNKKGLSLLFERDDVMLTDDSEKGEASIMSTAYLSY